jgi:hypothetical protein
MRLRFSLTLPLLGALIALPTPGSAQTSITVRFGARLGPEIPITSYSPERLGPWKHSYRNWTPVTLYDVNGRYYRNEVRGARPVLVYLYRDQYFLPPEDREWNGADRRYDYRRRPGPEDYGRARPYEAFTVDAQLGDEIGVGVYSRDRAGDWQANYRSWTPVTVYEVHGRYYPNYSARARPVQIYRYQYEYFLPPTDEAWHNYDKRFDDKHKPKKDGHDKDDHGRGHRRP